MNEYIKTVTLGQARKIAEEAAYEQLSEFMENKSINVLSEQFYEGECCWFFFKNDEIIGPPELVLRWGRAYAVSKKGDLRLIADFFDNPDKLNEYIKTMSDYFKNRGT